MEVINKLALIFWGTPKRSCTTIICLSVLFAFMFPEIRPALLWGLLFLGIAGIVFIVAFLVLSVVACSVIKEIIGDV